MRAARVQAQAKINLFLQVVPGRDAQGYHEINTLFRRIDLADDVVVRAGGSGKSIDCAGAQMPAAGLGSPESNLAYRAAVAFADRSGGWPSGFAIEIDKRIPVGGGLGGGSADAAAVLRALNALAPKPLTAEELHTVAAALGSDVPFLASGHLSALGFGRGTQLVAQHPMFESHRMLVVVPPFSIATADAYRWLEEDRTRRGVNQPGKVPPLPPITGIPDSQEDVRASLDKSTFNDFESVVEARHPEIRAIREELRSKGALVARLAGSGSCVFGLFGDLPPASLDLDFKADLLPTRISSRVVQVEVLE